MARRKTERYGMMGLLQLAAALCMLVVLPLFRCPGSVTGGLPCARFEKVSHDTIVPFTPSVSERLAQNSVDPVSRQAVLPHVVRTPLVKAVRFSHRDDSDPTFWSDAAAWPSSALCIPPRTGGFAAALFTEERTDRLAPSARGLVRFSQPPPLV